MSTAPIPGREAIDPAAAQWFKSSHSDAQGQGDCVRIATTFVATHDLVMVGDTKNPDVSIAVSPYAWTAFVRAVADGEFCAP
ncbi:DUF397 domain-containing protein [Kitasatospora indigofera]|uniref:DUF397 domain-containing protein n=2 Tax=Kitasatospora indigofera TaxID=67307 RepID=UPI00369922A4